MYIDPETGLLDTARQVASPNFDARPANTDIDLLVIHGISLPPGQFGGDEIDHLFTNRLDCNADPFFAEICKLQVSSHLLIRRNGEVVQYVPLHKRAWHAGVSRFGERESCNDFSIGIELEGTDGQLYEDCQYTVLNDVILSIRKAWPTITEQNIVGHCDIAPGRKTDPGAAFDWSKIKNVRKANC